VALDTAQEAAEQIATMVEYRETAEMVWPAEVAVLTRLTLHQVAGAEMDLQEEAAVQTQTETVEVTPEERASLSREQLALFLRVEAEY
jgi:hypothetical protein